MFTLTPVCYYLPDSDSPEHCAICGKRLDYSHILINESGEKIAVGRECVLKLRRNEQISAKLPRRGVYNWKLSDVRQEAYYNWYCASLAHAE